MTRRSRPNQTPAFRAKVVLAALRGERTLAEAHARGAVGSVVMAPGKGHRGMRLG